MIKFDLERALAGDKVITRDGQDATQIHAFKDVENYELYGVIGSDVFSWRINGKFYSADESHHDLFMAPKKLSGWVNLYKDNRGVIIHRTKYAADEFAFKPDRIACIDLSQYEEGEGI